jgi:DNA helicase-2/ATP-dependent DNA helicase PcrA
MERVINVPTRGIGAKTVANLRLSGFGPEQVLPPKVADFFALLERLRIETEGKNVAKSIEIVMERTKFREFLDDGSIEGQSRVENVKELITVAESSENLEEFLEAVALSQDADEISQKRAEESERSGEGAITLMTVHASKGLEYPVVFLVGMEEGIFPHSRSLSEKPQMEEERRLAYVAMTRAKDRLYLLYAFERRIYGLMQSNPLSRFIMEIPDELKEKI